LRAGHWATEGGGCGRGDNGLQKKRGDLTTVKRFLVCGTRQCQLARAVPVVRASFVQRKGVKTCLADNGKEIGEGGGKRGLTVDILETQEEKGFNCGNPRCKS